MCGTLLFSLLSFGFALRLSRLLFLVLLLLLCVATSFLFRASLISLLLILLATFLSTPAATLSHRHIRDADQQR